LISGSSEHTAREALVTAQRLEELPTTADRLREGTLSLAQAAHVSAAASVDPSAESGLLRVARLNGMRSLRTTAERVIAAATDEQAAHDLAVRERHLRTWVRGAATHGTFSGPTEEVAVLLAALGPREQAAFESARTAGTPEPADAYRFDALIGLARAALDGSPSTGTTASKPVVRVRVDLDALTRGATQPGEICEIPGVGPVSVAYARTVLSHGLLELVITDGVDVQTVVSPTRQVPTALKIAIQERDPTCKIRGCDRDQHLEGHHTHPYADHHHTSYTILGHLCPEHHDMLTHQGYQLIENDDRSWSLRAPPDHAAA
jgi:hypothetical protein